MKASVMACRTSSKNLVFSFFSSNIYFLKDTVAGGKGVSPDLSIHPIHLTPHEEGNLPPFAFIPFCSYQGNSSLLGQKRPELDDLEMCNKFESIILEGQLCYSLDIAKLGEKATKSGKSNGLFLLLDPDPYQSHATEKNGKGTKTGEQSFKVFIHTLAQYSTFGPGSYGMSSLKRMTGTTNFEQLPDHQKKCLVHNREECQTRKYLDQVQRECSCFPWTLETGQRKDQVKSRHIKGLFFAGFHLLWPGQGELCWETRFKRPKLFGSLFRPLC